MWFLIIYSLGAIVSYLWLRKVGRKSGNYTVSMRCMALGMSLFSWFMFLIMCLSDFHDWYHKVKDNKAKW